MILNDASTVVQILQFPFKNVFSLVPHQEVDCAHFGLNSTTIHTTAQHASQSCLLANTLAGVVLNELE